MSAREAEALEAAVLAGFEAHRSHRPALYRGADGIWRCPECDPPSLRERLAGFLSRQRLGITRRRR